MERLHIKDADIMRIAIQQEIERSEESRYDHRLHGVLMVSCGYSCTEVADLFGHSRRTVQYWVQRFEGRGFTGLQESERPGRPTTLNMIVRRNLEKDLRRSPRELRYSLTEKYGFDLGVRQCQRLFKQMGFRRRKPRPLIAHSDPIMQRAYKKTPSFGAKSKD